MTSKPVWGQKPCFLPRNVQRQLESYTYPSGWIITKPTINFSYLCVLAIWCEELTHWKRPWCWERLRAGGEGDDRGWDGWMASSTRWTWVWVDSGSWWWTGRPGVLWFMGSQRVGHDWATELNWVIVPDWLFAIPWTVACQAPLSMEFSRQEYWSGLPFPSPGDLPYPGIKHRSSALQSNSLPSKPPGKPLSSAILPKVNIRMTNPRSYLIILKLMMTNISWTCPICSAFSYLICDISIWLSLIVG